MLRSKKLQQQQDQSLHLQTEALWDCKQHQTADTSAAFLQQRRCAVTLALQSVRPRQHVWSEIRPKHDGINGKFIREDTRPDSVVENSGFHEMIQMLEPRFQTPS